MFKNQTDRRIILIYEERLSVGRRENEKFLKLPLLICGKLLIEELYL
jgi:hypothetical protein